MARKTTKNKDLTSKNNLKFLVPNREFCFELGRYY